MSIAACFVSADGLSLSIFGGLCECDVRQSSGLAVARLPAERAADRPTTDLSSVGPLIHDGYRQLSSTFEVVEIEL